MESEFTDKEFAYLLAQVRPRLLSFLMTRTFDAEKAKDLFADASVKALKAWRKGKYNRDKYDHHSFYNWFCSICVNLSIDHHRQKKLPVFPMPTYDDDDTEIPLPDPLASPVDKMLASEDEATREAIVEYLLDYVTDPLTREIIHLRCWEGKMFWEIAEILNMKLVTVKGIFWKTCNRLRIVYAVHQPRIRSHAGKKIAAEILR